jgi:hypothetical protein
LLRSKYVSTTETSKTVDLAQKLQYFVLDVISDVGVGKYFGHLKIDNDVDDYIKSMGEGLKMATIALGLGTTWLVDAPVIGRYLGPSEKDEKGFGKMMV